MSINKVESLTCGRCNNDFGWANYWQDYSSIFKGISWRCLVCYELERMETKHARENNKKPMPLPQNFQQLAKIKERKIEQIEDTIKELETQKDEIKKARY